MAERDVEAREAANSAAAGSVSAARAEVVRAAATKAAATEAGSPQSNGDSIPPARREGRRYRLCMRRFVEDAGGVRRGVARACHAIVLRKEPRA